MDGIDVALLSSDGRRIFAQGPAETIPYPPEFRERLRGLITGGVDREGVAKELTALHCDAVSTFLNGNALTVEDIDLIGFHGHTIAHNPEAGITVQIGDGAELARQTGIDVIDQFRAADVAAGGEGAPLAPLYHAALSAGLVRPLVVVNLGGVANVTWIGETSHEAGDPQLLAFDVGPGNALLDDWMTQQTGAAMDENGTFAAGGTADAAVIERFLTDPYFQRPPPKSLDRNAFSLKAVADLSPADGAATLVGMTVAAIVAAHHFFPSPPGRWLVSGGGRRNTTMMSLMVAQSATPVVPVEDVGWDGDAIEAQAFAFLAIRSRLGLALSLPTTTGVPRPVTGGTFHSAE